MRLLFEFAGRVLDITFGPVEPEPELDDDEPEPASPGAVCVDLTHQGGARIGFIADPGTDYSTE